MAKSIIKFKPGQVRKWGNKVKKQNDIAIADALKTVDNAGRKFTAKEVSEDSGLNQSQVKKAIGGKKATRLRLFFSWIITGKRLPWAKPRQIIGGASFLTDAKTRKKVTTPTKGGNRLFTAKSKRTKTKVAAYRPKGSKRAWHILSGHSLPYWIRAEWFKRVLDLMIGRMKIEYKKELKKARFKK